MDLLPLRVLLACEYPHLHSFLTDGARITVQLYHHERLRRSRTYGNYKPVFGTPTAVASLESWAGLPIS
jgi:hypothetical protein